MSHPNPFIVGQPLPPQYFVGHKDALKTILSLLGHPLRGSTSVIGSSYTGRSSLLRYLISDFAKQHHLELQPYWPVLFEALPNQDIDPQGFWLEVFQIAFEVCQDESVQIVVKKGIAKAEKKELSLPDIRKVIDSIGKTGHTLLLAIDNFENLMTHSKFVPPNDNEFFERFRHLCQRPSHGLAMVVTTPRSLQDHWQHPHGSIFYNIFPTALLGHLSDEEVGELLNRLLANTGIKFADSDKRIIHQRSANLPVFIQYYAGLIYEAYISGKDEQGRKEAINHALSKPDNMHVQLTRVLLKRMTSLERVAFDKVIQAPKSLSLDEKNLLKALEARGGLPPGVIIP